MKQAGFTWISVLIVLSVLGGLLTAGAPHWTSFRERRAKKIVFHEISQMLAFARTEAFLRGKTLRLSPMHPTGNWVCGVQLQPSKYLSDEVSDKIRIWYFPENAQLTWHGFLAQDNLLIAAVPDRLAMNGYFLFEAAHTLPERWVVNRFGRIRVLRKHVA
jgi:Tfp pilus assembly protein FimT